VDTPRETPLRSARTLAVAATALALGVGAHVLGGGTLPGAGALGGLGALTLLVASVASRSGLRRRVLLPVFGAWQLVLHSGLEIFTTASGGTHVPPSATTAAAHAHDHAAALLAISHPEHHAAGTSLTMALCHVLATLATVQLLAACDRAALLAARWWRRVRPTWLDAPAPPLLSWPTLPALPALVVSPGRVDLSSAPRRGPPSRATVRPGTLAPLG